MDMGMENGSGGTGFFESGFWKGFYLYNSIIGCRHEMEAEITFKYGDLSGKGKDGISHFILSGIYDADTCTCIFDKIYPSHTILYSGIVRGNCIHGNWYGAPGTSGKFRFYRKSIDLPGRLAEKKGLRVHGSNVRCRRQHFRTEKRQPFSRTEFLN